MLVYVLYLRKEPFKNIYIYLYIIWLNLIHQICLRLRCCLCTLHYRINLIYSECCHAFKRVSVFLCYFEAVLNTPCMFSKAPTGSTPFHWKLLCRSNHVFVPKAKRLRNAGALVIGDYQWEREERGWREAGEDGGEWKQGNSALCMYIWLDRT